MTKGVPWTYRHIWDGIGSWAVQSALSVNTYFGLRVKIKQAGYLVGLGYYRDAADTGNHVMFARHIGPGIVYEPRPFRYHNPNDLVVTGWEYTYFAKRIPVAANDVYVIFNLWGPFKYYLFTGGVGPSGIDNVYFNVPLDAGGAPNGVTSTIATYNPGTSLGGAYPGVDLIWWDGRT